MNASYHCEITGKLMPRDLLRPITTKDVLTFGDFVVRPMKEGEGTFEVRGTIMAPNQSAALDVGHRQLAALAHAFVLATGTPYALERGTVKQLDGAKTTIQLSMRVDALLKQGIELKADGVRKIDEIRNALESHLQDPRLRLILSDIDLAAQDRSKFALVHLYRALETIKKSMGVNWRDLPKVLNVPDDSLSFVKRLRSEGRYRIAHSSLADKVDEIEVTWPDIQKAFVCTVSILLAYLKHEAATTNA